MIGKDISEIFGFVGHQNTRHQHRCNQHGGFISIIHRFSKYNWMLFHSLSQAAVNELRKIQEIVIAQLTNLVENM